MKEISSALGNYTEFLSELKSRIQSARLSAARAVNRDLIRLYWDIGQVIVEKQGRDGWGEAVVETLARDLQTAFPGTGGFSGRNLRDMKRFYIAYSNPAFWRQAVAKLAPAGCGPRELPRQAVAGIPWGHHLLILNKLEAPTARLYYLRAVTQFGWSRNVLLNQIKARAYERSLKTDKAHNFPVAID